MVFKNFVCWNIENIEKILNVEATQTSDELFLATHHPIKMKKSDSIKGVNQTNYTEQDFLKDFLAPNDFAFVPVLGSAGTGKSHLIRWLSANIKSTEKRKVLLIPKLGTNLKDIIAQILSISDLEGEKFAEYRKRLTQAVSSLNQQEAKEQLLNQLAISVQDYPYEDEQLLKDKKWLQQKEKLSFDDSLIEEGFLDYIKENLHYLLYDPYFRKNYWLKTQGIIEVLTSHILGSNNKLEIIEERREFTIDDIPHNASDFQNASKNAREIYEFLLGDENHQLLTAGWLNFNLDRAIAKLLNLGGDDLQILMREVRETLAEKEIELILLIEDFAKLQGIDREVLEAVLAKPQQIGQKPLCVMRTALACTTGYFNSLMDTVQERTSFIVNLDLGTVGDVSPSEIITMASRYLNAVRCDNETLNNWAMEFKQGESRDLPPSHCQDCQHQTTCHGGFGEVNNYGLYPFNDRALINMLKRVNPDTFKPRILIKDVLKYVLEHSFMDIKQGAFPSPSLKNHFGNVGLIALVQDDIRRKDNANAERREILIDLWTNETQLVDCAEEIHTAFNLPSLGVKISSVSIPVKPSVTINQSLTSSSSSPVNLPIKSSTTTVKESETIYQPDDNSDSKKGSIPENLQKKINSLDNWNNEEILDQYLAKEIREFIYSAVVDRIDWDVEILLKGSFASQKSIFKQRNITFHSPKVNKITIAGIGLSLPLNPENQNDFRDSAIAFQGILLFQHYKHWNFPNGDRYFRAYATQLEKWSQYILQEIRRRPSESEENWNPIPATVELLAITTTISGNSAFSIENLINSLYVEISDKSAENRAKSWKDLYLFLQKNRDKLLEILNSLTGCTKGGNPKFQIIDAIQLINPLKTLKKDWQPQEIIPDNLATEYEIIKKVRDKIDELLIPAIQEETERQLTIYESLISEFGEKINKKDLINHINTAIEKARQAGVFGQKSSQKLEEIVKTFNSTRFSSYRETMIKIKEKQNQEDTAINQLLPYLSENYQKAMTNIDIFINETNTFLDTSIERANNEILQLQSSSEENVESIIVEINHNLTQLENYLCQLKN